VAMDGWMVEGRWEERSKSTRECRQSPLNTIHSKIPPRGKKQAAAEAPAMHLRRDDVIYIPNLYICEFLNGRVYSMRTAQRTDTHAPSPSACSPARKRAKVRTWWKWILAAVSVAILLSLELGERKRQRRQRQEGTKGGCGGERCRL
jgi:hypothetical protein